MALQRHASYIKKVLVAAEGQQIDIVMKKWMLVLAIFTMFSCATNKNYTKNYVSKGPFEILQVLDNHNALAYQIYSLGRTSTGVLVLLSDKKVQDFYDGQIIKIPRGKRAKQIRTFTYITKQGISKTVPVVEIQDK